MVSPVIASQTREEVAFDFSLTGRGGETYENRWMKNGKAVDAPTFDI